MSNSLAVLVLIGGVAGVTAAGVTTVFLAPAEVPYEEAALSRAEAEQLLSGMKALQEQSSVLQRRVESLESSASIQAPVIPRREEVPQPKTDEDIALENEVRAFLDTFKDPSGAAPNEIKDTVADALRTIREEEDRARDERRAQQRAQRMDERLAALSVELSLSPTQTGDLKVLFTNTEAERDAVFAEARESGEWGNMRETVRGLYDQQSEKVAQILTPDQYTKYQESDNRASFSGGRFGGRSNDGGGGRRGGGGGGNSRF